MDPHQFMSHQAAAISGLVNQMATPQGLLQMADATACAFTHSGKAVVTGMGKSGMIGRKIAATLQSTGQPAAFLDPAAAAHGDMGIIQRGDFVLALSNSGKTAELIPVLEYCLENGRRIIAITSNLESPLAKAADVVLAYPVMPEGCPIGRAPMASTLMQLALGDCLAAMLMDQRKFSDADFLALHHGGYLGADIRNSLCPK